MRVKKLDSQEAIPKQRPASTPEGRENQMINYAVSLAEKQLREGTASSQVITHYLKLASSKDRLEREKLELEKELLVAKTEAIQSAKRVDEMYEKAIKAMSIYSGKGEIETDE